MVTVADVISRARLRVQEVPINLDGELLGEIDNLREEWKRATRVDMRAGGGLASTAPGIGARLAEAEQRADDEATTFRVRALAGEAFDDLKRRYPPTEEQWQRYREEAAASPLLTRAPEFDLDEVWPRLIGLSVVAVDGEDVAWTEADGIELWRSLHDGARADLGNAVWNVNNRSSIRPTSGIGTEETASSDPESTTPLNGGSPSPSS
ncbi:MAG: hypothetical protein L0Z49_07190 [Actinobacteria bacterium]|nr:hypothetical protein [Actinomycetota bacterium]